MLQQEQRKTFSRLDMGFVPTAAKKTPTQINVSQNERRKKSPVTPDDTRRPTNQSTPYHHFLRTCRTQLPAVRALFAADSSSCRPSSLTGPCPSSSSAPRAFVASCCALLTATSADVTATFTVGRAAEFGGAERHGNASTPHNSQGCAQRRCQVQNGKEACQYKRSARHAVRSSAASLSTSCSPPVSVHCRLLMLEISEQVRERERKIKGAKSNQHYVGGSNLATGVKATDHVLLIPELPRPHPWLCACWLMPPAASQGSRGPCQR